MMRRWPREKYSNEWTAYNGHNFQSKSEARHARDLDLMRAAGEVDRWVAQARFPIIVGGEKVCTYVVDFLVRLPNGAIEAHEVKGLWTKDGLLKSRLFSILYPNVPLRIFGQQPPAGRASSSKGGAGRGQSTLARPSDWFSESRSTRPPAAGSAREPRTATDTGI